MANHYVSLLDFTTEAGNSGRCDAILIGANNIGSVSRHDGLLVDIVNESIEKDYNNM